MNGTTAVIIGGALLIATAAGVYVWYTHAQAQKQQQRQESSAAVVAAVGGAQPGQPMSGAQVVSSIQAVLNHSKATLPTPAGGGGSSGGGGLAGVMDGINSAAGAIGSIINTGKSILDTATGIFDNFKLF